MNNVEIDIDKVLRDKMGSKARFVPRFVTNWLKRIIHQDDMNGFFRAHKDEEGVQWLKSVVEYADMRITVHGLENLPADSDHRFTFASNHPLGGIDGVSLGAILGEHYDGNIRYLLNDILMNLPGLRPLGVAVNVTGSQGRESMLKVDEVFASNHQLIMFPAQLCSRMIKGKVQDLPWKKAVVQKSVQHHRDIVPIFFSGQNSKRFYRIANWSKRLGLKVNIAMLFLVDELYRNMHKPFDVYIGKPIPWQTFTSDRSYTDWAQWLRSQVYEIPLTIDR
ncbi:MAG: 1-acyl-sn-glycerol-3-phosphate acyltransferase [Bacteroidaceae bacterium]|nr:1-acyl-sn-glycerol-3-phosphate acyltransferase [Bacteroidaceae bacterium]